MKKNTILMKITTSRIVLDHIDSEDIDLIHSYTYDFSNLNQFFSSKIRSKIHWKKRFEENGIWDDSYGMLKIIDKEDNNLIGVIWFFKPYPDIQMNCYEIAFNIFNVQKRKKGFATEAVQLLTSYLFETYNIQRIQSNTVLDINDLAIKRTIEKIGYSYEGTLRKVFFNRGKYIDMHLFSIMKDESIPLKEQIELLS